MAEETPTEQKKKERKRTAPAAPPPRLRERYRSEVLPALQRELEIANPMRVPRLEKIVINMGVGDAIRDAKLLDAAVADLATITGQKPVITRARKSIAQFKLREGMAIGAKVTLRGARMWEFLDRLLSTALPRIRDFRGLNSDAFDGSGNYSVGVTEQLIFPEIDYDKVVKVRGMDITVVTTALGDDEARSLLRALGFPFAGQPAVSAA
jgi:large subunit ribosomal protein L5